MYKFLPVILIAALLGCTPAPVSEFTPIPEATITPTVDESLQIDETPPTQHGPVTLKLWIPPQFDPSNGSPQAELLKNRLDEFVQRRSDIRIETRIKNVEGPGGILDTLTSASAVAPLALPDLVALPNHSLKNAAIKGLLHPFDDLTDTMDNPEWYEFARTFSQIESTIIGIPFAGDALIMVYRPSVIGNGLKDWESSLKISGESPISLSFPAADPYSFFTLLLYQSVGGSILDDEDRPVLNKQQLEEVLSYYQQAEQSGFMPYWLTQYETFDQSWVAYEDKQTDLVITWASQYLQNPPVDSTGAPIPTQDGVPFTIATGWAWALSSSDPAHQEISTQLAEFLTSKDFLGEWTAAGGYIPPRADALSGWENVSMKTLLSQIAPTADLIPTMDVLTALGPSLQKATIDILKEQANPDVAAEEAIGMLSQP
jgi:ABC-type glycerol-3-phosphate transport system substrate-binding protein